jgi:hypothetical protein
VPINFSVNSARIQNTSSSACSRRITFFAELFLTSISGCAPVLTLIRNSGWFRGMSFLTCIFSGLRYWVSIGNFTSEDKKQVFRIACEYCDIKSARTFSVVKGCRNNSQSAMCVTLILLVTGFKFDRISLINYTLLRTHSANLTGTLVNAKLNNRNLKCLHYLYRS